MSNPKPLAAPLSQPDKQKVKSVYPHAYQNYWNDGIFSDSIHWGDKENARLGDTWADAASKLPTEIAAPLPEPQYKHACPEWDGMEIDETWPEFEACICFKKASLPEPTKVNKMIDFASRIFAHAFTHQSDLSEDACAYMNCGKPENHHHWTTSKPNVEGTFACPICGGDTPHEHAASEIAEFRVNRTKVAKVSPLPEIASPTWGGDGPEPTCGCGRPVTQCTRLHDDHFPPASPVPLGEPVQLSELPDNNGRFSTTVYLAYCLEIRESELRTALATKAVPIQAGFSGVACASFTPQKDWPLFCFYCAMTEECHGVKAVPIGEGELPDLDVNEEERDRAYKRAWDDHQRPIYRALFCRERQLLQSQQREREWHSIKEQALTKMEEQRNRAELAEARLRSQERPAQKSDLEHIQDSYSSGEQPYTPPK